MGKPVAVIGKAHVCPQIDPGPKPHIGGPVVTGRSFVRINGIPVAVVGDATFCTGCGCVDKIVSGSKVARINGQPIARLGDGTDHGGRITEGVASVRLD